MFNQKSTPLALLFVMVVSFLTSCVVIAQPAPANGPLKDLIVAAQKEGQLNLVGVQSDWCNYGEIIEKFGDKYGIAINKIDAEANSEKQIELIKNNKGPQIPDVVDINFIFASQLTDENLVVPYKVTTWDTIPDNLKNENGYWYGGYFGAVAFEVNLDVVKNIPQDWADLLKPEYKGQVAFAGNPRTYSEAQMVVYAAALGNAGSLDDTSAGLHYFRQLSDAGNMDPMLANQMEIARGTTPIALRIDYNAFADKIAADGNPPIEIIIPKSGTLASVNVLSISKNALHPSTAKLWMEFLFSDEGQLLWLKDGCHAIRYTDLVSRAVIPDEISRQLPSPEAYNQVVFPSISQTRAARQSIANQWMSIVGVDFKK